MVHISTDILPRDKPRYLMGVGFAEDLVVCCALGVDMFDCVFPTRTAVRIILKNYIEEIHKFFFQRFGCALLMTGQINLKHKKFAKDLTPIDEECDCPTCKTYTKAYIHQIVNSQAAACHIISIHNVAFQLRLMKNIRDSIVLNKYPEFVVNFMSNLYPEKNYPTWIVDALKAVNIELIN